jgi:hypothetical protein
MLDMIEAQLRPDEVEMFNLTAADLTIDLGPLGSLLPQ